jgi:hypothetical protein
MKQFLTKKGYDKLQEDLIIARYTPVEIVSACAKLPRRRLVECGIRSAKNEGYIRRRIKRLKVCWHSDHDRPKNGSSISHRVEHSESGSKDNEEYFIVGLRAMLRKEISTIPLEKGLLK